MSDFDVEMYLSPSSGSNFRYEVAETRPYKGNRDRTHRPTHEADLRNYIIENWPTTIAEGEEADDLLGIEQTADPNNTIIVSLDKDLDQIPGLKYNFVADRSYEITQEQAHYNFHIQLMAGDSTDNIPGLPGVGVGKAAKALHGITDPMEQLAEVWRMYQIKSGVKDPWKYLHEQGQLLHIRRHVGQMWSVPDTFGFPNEDMLEWEGADLSLF
jgi:5'-3' exonuclease